MRTTFATAVGVALCVGLAALRHAPVSAQPPKAETPTVADFQKRIDEYGRRWTMTDGRIDLTKIDEFYAPGEGVVIFDFAPPGVSASWAAHRTGLEKELFSKLKVNTFVPRQDVTLRLVGDKAAVTTFTFDYQNESKDGTKFKLTGRQSNVWEKTDKGWVIVHEHGSPVPTFKDK
jgi:ketosteroid isomerase-like protein